MASTTSTTAVTALSSGGSLAKDLGAQYERLYGAQVLDATEAADGNAYVSPLLLVPQGLRVESVKKFIDEFREVPERRRGTATLRDVASFVAHVNRFKDADSVVFANPDRSAPSLTAVLDYHEAGAIGDVKPRWGTHRAVYPAPLSDEWKTWTGAEERAMSQADFAEFIDANMADVMAAPRELPPHLQEWAALVGGRFASPASLLGLSRNLQVNVSTTVRQAITLDTGEVAITYDEQHKDGEGAPIRVPNLFLVGIPVFFNGPRWTVPARLRYRIQAGKLVWSFQLYQAERVFDQAFEEVCSTVRTDTALPLFVGTPEG